jgi:predicted Zn-dependent protease with MMP-like domain
MRLDVGEPSTPRRVAFAAVVAFSLGLVAIVAFEGFSDEYALRFLEGIACAVLASAIVGGLVAFFAVRLAGWRNPVSEQEFEEMVVESERLAREGVAAEPDEGEFMALDPLDDEDFAEIVRDALDELPDLLLNALEHVAVVISDDGRRRGAYGLYHGDGAHRDNHPDRIVIYRDTLRRDFGHDPDLLRQQVIRTVRHELAHHVGFDELGVRGLGL